MRVTLFLLREKGGLVPKWQRATHHGFEGELHLAERQDEVFNRSSRVAELLEIGTGKRREEVPALYDAQLILCKSSLLVLSGVERIEDPIARRSYDYSQTWWLQLATN